MSIPATVVGADPLGINATEHPYPGEVSEHYAHSTWTDDVILAAKTPKALQNMVWETHATFQKHGLRIVDHKTHLWSLDRPLKAEGDLIVFGFSVVAGGPIAYERRIAKA